MAKKLGSRSVIFMMVFGAALAGMLSLTGSAKAASPEFLGGTLISKGNATELGVICVATDAQDQCVEGAYIFRFLGQPEFRELARFEIRPLDKQLRKKLRKAIRRARGRVINEKFQEIAFGGTLGGAVLCYAVGSNDSTRPLLPIVCPVSIVTGAALDLGKAPLVAVAYAGARTAGLFTGKFMRYLEFMLDPSKREESVVVSNTRLDVVMRVIEGY